MLLGDVERTAATDQGQRSTERERVLRLIVDSFPGLAAYLDREFRYRFTNKAYAEWFGRTDVNFAGMSIEDAFGRGRWEPIKAEMERAFAGEKVTYEARFAYRPDFERDVRVRYIPDQSEEGYIRGVVILIEDITERKAAEQATRRSEERYRAMVDASAQFVWITDAAGNNLNAPVEWWNNLTGQSEQERQGWGWLEAVHPGDRERVRRQWSESLTHPKPFEEEYRIRTKDGTYRHFAARGVPVWSEDGSLFEFVGTLDDITDRKLAEETQKEIDRQLTLLIEASGTLLASPESADVLRNILELAKQFIAADAYSLWRKMPNKENWQIVAMSGLSEQYSSTAEDLARDSHGRPPEPLVIEDIRKLPRMAQRTTAYEAEGIQALITGQLKIHGELAGTLVFYYRQPHHFTEPEIRVASALGNLAAAALRTADLYAREAEMRRRAEEEKQKATFLAEAGQLLASSLDYDSTLKRVAEMAVPLFADLTAIDVVDRSGQIRRVVVHGKTEEKTALTYEFRRQFPLLETDLARTVLRTGKSAFIAEVTDEMLAARARSPEYLEFVRRLGPRSMIFAPLVANNRSIGVISFVKTESGQYTAADLALAEELARRAATAVENARLFTESQEAQQALTRANQDLRSANEDLNQFAYSASHDLQEPLRILTIYSQLLDRDYRERLDGRAREYLGFVIDGAKRMELLLRDLLAYIQAVGSPAAEMVPVDVGAVLETVEANLNKSITESGAEIIHSGLPSLRMDETHLVQLFQNLIGNAIKYRSKAAPRIQISAQRNGTEWLFRVRDNGIGIPAEYQSQVFGIFKRLHTKEQYPGTGIGLAICQKLVERYGGRIWVESGQNEGSTFCFTVPE